MPVDFISASRGDAGNIQGNGQSMKPVSDREYYYAQKIIPKGYTATACVVKGVDASGGGAMICYQTDIDGTAASAVSASVSFSSGAWTMPFSVASIVGDGEKICTIAFDPDGISDIIYGGKITIAKT